MARNSVLSKPAKKAGAPSQAPARGQAPAASRDAAGSLPRRLRTAGAVVALLCVTAVGWNALMLQTGKHPAPLFGVKASADTPERREVAALPLPTPRPEVVSPAVPAGDPPQKSARSTDPIGALIRSGEPPRAADAKDVQRVASAQRALIKLGYGPLKSDGVMGLGTRQAVERYERDRNLPVTGAIGGRTARQLAQQAGIEIE